MIEPPGAEAQIAFLQKLQRIYEEGDFTATYKFALLMALAELAVERGADTGEPLALKLDWIAEKFAEFYWPQSSPYSAGTRGTARGVLAQNLGQQAAVIRQLIEFRRAHPGPLVQSHGVATWSALIAGIGRVVRDQPVNYLQNVGGQSVRFLYEIGPRRGELTLLPGVAYCLRRFQALVHQLSRSGWVRHVRENTRNRIIIGEAGDLEAFMFGHQRANLEPVRAVLLDAQLGKCFYCDCGLREQGAVDHFIPWSRYPRDLAHNFVLAHAACNGSKSDMLASRRHLERWRDTIDGRAGEELGQALAAKGVIADAECSRTVTRWAYAQGLAIGAMAWIRQDSTEPIDEGFLKLLF